MNKYLPEFYCPACCHQFLALSPKKDRFYCGSCHVHWKIEKMKK